MRAMENALWKWLETRRDWWARIVARGADIPAAAGHRDAERFAATALALVEGRDLKNIPVLENIRPQTIEAWMFDDPDAGQDVLPENVPEAFAGPQPERKGELARLVKGSAVWGRLREGAESYARCLLSHYEFAMLRLLTGRSRRLYVRRDG